MNICLRTNPVIIMLCMNGFFRSHLQELDVGGQGQAPNDTIDGVVREDLLLIQCVSDTSVIHHQALHILPRGVSLVGPSDRTTVFDP